MVKAYRPSVANADKINLLPEINDTTRFRPDLNYQIISHPIGSGFHASVMKAANQFQREISYPGYGKISGGFGTNMSPFMDLYLSNPNSQNGTLGIQFNHLSSQGKVNLRGGDEVQAPFSFNRAVVYGSYLFEGVTIASELSYQRDMNRFYGYPVAIPANISTNNFVKYYNQEELNQYGDFDFKIKSNASSKSDLKFDADVNLGYFSTSTSQVEKAINVKSAFDYDFGSFNGKLSASYEHLESENVTEMPEFFPVSSPKSSLLQLTPTILFRKDYLSLEAGLNLSAIFDAVNGNTFRPYPKAAFYLHSEDNNIGLYATADGYTRFNSYSGIAEENRWINPALLVKPTIQQYLFSGGIKGKIATPLSFNLGIKYGKALDQYFYVTRVLNQSGKTTPALTDLTYNNAFEVEYDNLGTLDFSGELSYSTSNLFLLLSGHFYNYQLSSLEKAPYMPDFLLSASSSFRITDKISGLAEFLLTGPRSVMLKYYMSPVSSTLPPPPIYLNTDAMLDANIGAKYRFTKQLEFFGRIENLLDRRDEPWYGYTVQGIRFKLGAGFSF